MKRQAALMSDSGKGTRSDELSLLLQPKRMLKKRWDHPPVLGPRLQMVGAALQRACEFGLFMKERVMVQPRLTGLEFSWFTKCQMMASNYAQHWEMDLEPNLGDLVQIVASDARTSFAGPQSMRRVAERLTLAADAMAAAGNDQAPGANVRREGSRCTEALRYLASQLASTAASVEAWKHSSASALATDQVPLAPLV